MEDMDDTPRTYRYALLKDDGSVNNIITSDHPVDPKLHPGFELKELNEAPV